MSRTLTTFLVAIAISLTTQTAFAQGAVTTPPVANNDSATTSVNTPVNIAVLVNDIAASGNPIDPKSVKVERAPSNGVDTASPGNDGLLIQGDGSASITGDINSSSFLRNRANGLQVINNGSGTVDVEIGTTAACTFQNNNVGANIAHNGAGSLAFDVFNSSFSAPAGGAASPINLNKATAGTGTMSGTVSGNTITNANSASGLGIRVNGNGVGGTLTTLIQSNNISAVANRGIEVIARDGNNTLNATVTNNIVQLTDPLSDNGIWMESGTIASDTTTICAAISGNDSDTAGAGQNGIRMQNIRAGTTFRVPSFAGPATDADGEHDLMNAHIAGLNPATPSIRARHLIGNSGFIPGGAACPTP